MPRRRLKNHGCGLFCFWLSTVGRTKLIGLQIGHSLLETANMPSVFWFAECITSGTRQRAYLPSVVKKTLGIHIALGKKPDLPSIVYQTLSKQQYDTRQSIDTRQNTITWPARAMAVWRRAGRYKKCYFAECFSPALGKIISLPSVFYRHSAKPKLFFLSCPPNFFYYPHTTCVTTC